METGNIQVHFSNKDMHTSNSKTTKIKISTGTKGVCLCNTILQTGTELPLPVQQ